MRVMSIYFGRKDSPFLSPPQPRQPTITDLFGHWQDARQDHSSETNDQYEARYERYLVLQAKITSMRPRSVREAAIQIMVETDDGCREYRPEFFNRIRLIALGDV